MAAAQPNHRASLLAGLRTGGVRSVSVPHTAAPAGSFNVPRVQSNLYHNSIFPEEDEIDQLSDMVSQNVNIRDPRELANRTQPRTASLDHLGSRLSQQQQELLMQRQMHSQMTPMSPAAVPSADYQAQAQAQAQMQMQIMQMELMRLQALAQMQQYAQMQSEQDCGPQQGRRSMYEPPSTAGPRTQTFNMNGGSSHSVPRSRQTEQNDYGSVPMTATLGGRFGGRPQNDSNGNGHPSNRSANSNTPVSASVGPSKSDAAVSWRRGSGAVPSSKSSDFVNSALRPQNRVTPPSSDSERDPSPVPFSKARPEPLSLAKGFSVPAIPVSSNDDADNDSSSSKSDKSDSDHNSSSPTTPMSSNSQASAASAREEASKKLFQGLGLGRPSIHVTAPSESKAMLPPRATSHPMRQPRGPPGPVDELGDKNFANRIRKKAIGGLGALIEARGKRDGILEVEAA